MNTDYSELDAAIIASIKAGRDKFFRICDQATLNLAAQFGRDGWRVIDRRLQALSKAGKIEFRKGAWRNKEVA